MANISLHTAYRYASPFVNLIWQHFSGHLYIQDRLLMGDFQTIYYALPEVGFGRIAEVIYGKWLNPVVANERHYQETSTQLDWLATEKRGSK